MKRSSAILSMILLSTACGGAGGTHVVYPGGGQSFDAATASFLDRTERGMARQDSLDARAIEDSATLVRLDGQSVCFDVITRLPQAAGSGLAVPYVTLDPSTVELAFDGGTLGAPTIMARQLRVGPPRIGEATNYFVEDANHEVHSETTTFQYEVVSGGGIVCFDHRGAIAATNHHLRLTYGQVSWTPRFDFQIDVDARATSWPDGPTVARGYEQLAR